MLTLLLFGAHVNQTAVGDVLGRRSVSLELNFAILVARLDSVIKDQTISVAIDLPSLVLRPIYLRVLFFFLVLALLALLVAGIVLPFNVEDILRNYGEILISDGLMADPGFVLKVNDQLVVELGLLNTQCQSRVVELLFRRALLKVPLEALLGLSLLALSDKLEHGVLEENDYGQQVESEVQADDADDDETSAFPLAAFGRLANE